MGRVGAAGDNAATESFFAFLPEDRAGHPRLADPARATARDRVMDQSERRSSTRPPFTPTRDLARVGTEINRDLELFSTVGPLNSTPGLC